MPRFKSVNLSVQSVAVYSAFTLASVAACDKTPALFSKRDNPVNRGHFHPNAILIKI